MSGLPPLSWNINIEKERILSSTASETLTQQENLIREIIDLGEQTSNAVYGEVNKWVPTATSPSGASVSTYGVQAGHYVRWGHMVWFTLNIQYNSADVTGTGDLNIRGLPVAAKNQTNAKIVLPAYNAESGTEFVGMAFIEPNERHISVVKNGATTIQIEAANYDIQISGTYRAL